MNPEDLEEWERWAADLRKAAELFADNRSLDAATRKNYIDTIRMYSQLVLRNMYDGTMSPADAKLTMYTLRDEVLQASRKDLSPLGRRLSQILKKESLTLTALEAKYAAEVDKELAAVAKHISKEERFARVCEKIVEAGGRDRGWVSKLSGPLAKAARLVHTLTWIIAIVSVITAEDHVDAAARVGFTWASAKAGAWTGAAICAETGPGAGICAVVGAIIGGFGGDYLYDLAKKSAKEILNVILVPIGMRVRPRTAYDLIKHR